MRQSRSFERVNAMGLTACAFAFACLFPLSLSAQTAGPPVQTSGTNSSGYGNTSGYTNTQTEQDKSGYTGPQDLKTKTGNQGNQNFGSTDNSALNSNLPNNSATGAGGATGFGNASGSNGATGFGGSSSGGSSTTGSGPSSSGGTASGGGTSSGGTGTGGSGSTGAGYQGQQGYQNQQGQQGSQGQQGYQGQQGFQGQGGYNGPAGYNGPSIVPNDSGYGNIVGPDEYGVEKTPADESHTPTAKFENAKSAGQVFCNAFYNAGNIPNFISILAYLAGMAIFIRGAFDIIKRSSDPNKPLRDGLLGLLVGAFIVTLPWFAEFLHNSIYHSSTAFYKVPECKATAGVNPASVVPLDEMLTNFVTNIKGPIMSFISLMAMIMGTAMIFWNMVRLSKFGADAKSNTLTPIITNLVIGAMLLAVGQTMNVSLATLFGTGTTQETLAHYDTLAYVPGGSFSMKRFDNAIKAVFVFLYIIGALSFLRGFMILRNAVDGQGQATKGQAFTHIIGGTLLVNMPGFIHIIENTMGFSIIKTVGG